MKNLKRGVWRAVSATKQHPTFFFFFFYCAAATAEIRPSSCGLNESEQPILGCSKCAAEIKKKTREVLIFSQLQTARAREVSIVREHRSREALFNVKHVRSHVPPYP